MTGIRIIDELGDGPCGFCINFKRCKNEKLACGVFVCYVNGNEAPEWAKKEAGRNPTRLGYEVVFSSHAL